MNVIVYTAFKDEMEKIAYHSVVDFAGLGVLAAPTIQKMRHKEMSDKGTHAAELGGLGMLAGTSAHKIYKAFKKGGLAAIKHASVNKQANLGQTAGATFGVGSKTMSSFVDPIRRQVQQKAVPLAQRVAQRKAMLAQVAGR